jgi:chain length determinant protein EpsF
MAFPTMAMPSFMATQIDILTSDRVALRVIKDLKLADNADIRRQWQEESEGKGTFEQYLVDVLQKGLDVKPSRESNVINIEYKAGEPRFAAGMANAFAQAYIATTLELKVDPAKQFSSFFTSQTKEARELLEKAQTRLSAYQREKGIIATDERLDIETQRLNELSSQLVMMQAVATESQSRQAAAGRSADRIQEVINNPLISGMKADLARTEGRLQELQNKYGDAHPQVQEAKANIATLRSRLEAETAKVTGSVGVTSTINKERETQVRTQLEAQRAKVLQMKAVRDEGQVLIRDVENAQRAFDSLMARLNQTALESQTTQSYANMLTVAQPASQPSSPKLVLNTALSVFAGLLLAVGTALLLEMVDRRVRAPEDAVAALGLPVLGVLPKPKAKRFVSGRRGLLQGPARAAPALPGPNPNAQRGA